MKRLIIVQKLVLPKLKNVNAEQWGVIATHVVEITFKMENA